MLPKENIIDPTTIKLESKKTEPTPKDLIKQLLQSYSIQDVEIMLTYLNTFEKPMQKKLANDLELRTLTFGTIVRIIQENAKAQTRKTIKNSDNQSQNLTDVDSNKILQKVADFFNLFGK